MKKKAIFYEKTNSIYSFHLMNFLKLELYLLTKQALILKIGN